MVKKVLIFGGRGNLASELVRSFSDKGVDVDVVTRGKEGLIPKCNKVYCVERSYLEFFPKSIYDIIIFTQGIYEPVPITENLESSFSLQIQVGLIDPMILTQRFLNLLNSTNTIHDFCFIGSTSSYDGFPISSIYCAVKHGLLGFTRALNAEYAKSSIRFWLFSMGSMRNKMGVKDASQNVNTFLDPVFISKRIVESLLTNENIFEPEMLIRRRNLS